MTYDGKLYSGEPVTYLAGEFPKGLRMHHPAAVGGNEDKAAKAAVAMVDKPMVGQQHEATYLDDNPKDALGRRKVPLELLPPAGLIYQAMAQGYGAAKYGPFNWRTKKVKGMIYAGAARRHILAYIDGHDLDDGYKGSGLPHLGMALACIAILVDATETGNLHDDRPPAGEMTELMDKFNAWLSENGWGVERQTDALTP